MEWHQTALGLFQQYLVSQRHLCLFSQVTEAHARGWVECLQTTPSAKDTTRASATIATYARSARAFCHWGIRNGYLKRSPFVKGIIPQPGRKAIHPIEPDVFDRLLLACRPAGEAGLSLDRVAARNQSILWILMDTGMRVSELCGLCLSDVNHEQRSLRVQGRGPEEHITPSLLRDTFAVRYLQAGGEPEALRAILGLTGMESVKRYEWLSTRQIEQEPQPEPTEEHRSQAMTVPQKSIERRRKPSSVTTRSQQQKADRTHRVGKKKTTPDAEEDP